MSQTGSLKLYSVGIFLIKAFALALLVSAAAYELVIRSGPAQYNSVYIQDGPK